jgi:hypothetical protein
MTGHLRIVWELSTVILRGLTIGLAASSILFMNKLWDVTGLFAIVACLNEVLLMHRRQQT